MNKSTKELIIYFNNEEDCLFVGLECQANSPEGPFIIWRHQEGNSTKTNNEDGVLIEYGNDTHSVISLIRDKQITKINVHIHGFYKGCLAYCDIYKTSLFNSAYKYTCFYFGD